MTDRFMTNQAVYPVPKRQNAKCIVSPLPTAKSTKGTYSHEIRHHPRVIKSPESMKSCQKLLNYENSNHQPKSFTHSSPNNHKNTGISPSQKKTEVPTQNGNSHSLQPISPNNIAKIDRTDRDGTDSQSIDYSSDNFPLEVSPPKESVYHDLVNRYEEVKQFVREKMISNNKIGKDERMNKTLQVYSLLDNLSVFTGTPNKIQLGRSHHILPESTTPNRERSCTPMKTNDRKLSINNISTTPTRSESKETTKSIEARRRTQNLNEFEMLSNALNEDEGYNRMPSRGLLAETPLLHRGKAKIVLANCSPQNHQIARNIPNEPIATSSSSSNHNSLTYELYERNKENFQHNMPSDLSNQRRGSKASQLSSGQVPYSPTTPKLSQLISPKSSRIETKLKPSNDVQSSTRSPVNSSSKNDANTNAKRVLSQHISPSRHQKYDGSRNNNNDLSSRLLQSPKRQLQTDSHRIQSPNLRNPIPIHSSSVSMSKESSNGSLTSSYKSYETESISVNSFGWKSPSKRTAKRPLPTTPLRHDSSKNDSDSMALRSIDRVKAAQSATKGILSPPQKRSKCVQSPFH